MKTSVVVEGQEDVAVLRALLRHEVAAGAVNIVAAGGRSALPSIARTMLVKHGAPLVVLGDTDSSQPSAVTELRTTTEQLIRAVAGETPFRVIYCTPTLEAIFFEASIDLKRLFPKFDPSFFQVFAKTSPKEALHFLFEHGNGPQNLTEFLAGLSEDDVNKLRSTGPIAQLVSFVNEMCHPAVA